MLRQDLLVRQQGDGLRAVRADHPVHLEGVVRVEFVLEGLYAQNKISRNEEGGYTAATKARKDRRGMIYDDLTETGRYS